MIFCRFIFTSLISSSTIESVICKMFMPLCQDWTANRADLCNTVVSETEHCVRYICSWAKKEPGDLHIRLREL